MSLATKFLSETHEIYDGHQLAPLWNYLQHGLVGSSCVSWIGPCQVPLEAMVDGEDVRAQSVISGASMVHFIAELFDIELKGAIAFQRLMVTLARDVLEELSGQRIVRRGDDLYWQGGKLSISIATRSLQSCLIHFAVNVTRAGTPVVTSSLADLGVQPSPFAEQLLRLVQAEWDDLLFSYYKVRTKV